MGQKVHPVGIRLGITKTWNSKWYADKKDYAALLQEDLRIQQYIKSHMKHAGIARMEVERAAQKVKVSIYASRPGIIIGRRGESADALKDELIKLCGREITVNIKEVKRPEIDAQLIAQNIATQLQRRIAFRRAIKRALASAMRLMVMGPSIPVAPNRPNCVARNPIGRKASS